MSTGMEKPEIWIVFENRVWRSYRIHILGKGWFRYWPNRTYRGTKIEMVHKRCGETDTIGIWF